jgi:hypothetical protein
MHSRGLLLILLVAASLAVDAVVILQDWSAHNVGRIAVGCLMLSQTSLLAAWCVLGRGALAIRLSLLAIGIGAWSWQWDRSGDVPAVDMACLLLLLSTMVATPLVIFRQRTSLLGKWQVSLAALVGLVTVSGLALGLARQFSRPDDMAYVGEMFGLVIAMSLTTLAAVALMLGRRMSAFRGGLFALAIGIAALILSAVIVGETLLAGKLVGLHTVLVLASLAVWRICGVRLAVNPPPSAGQ